MMWGDNSGWGMWLGMGISTLILVVLIALLVWSISRIGRVEAPRPQRERPTALDCWTNASLAGRSNPTTTSSADGSSTTNAEPCRGGADPAPLHATNYPRSAP